MLLSFTVGISCRVMGRNKRIMAGCPFDEARSVSGKYALFSFLQRAALVWGTIIFLVGTGTSIAFRQPSRPPFPNLESRPGAGPNPHLTRPDRTASQDKLKKRIRGVEVDLDEIIKAPKWIGSTRGFLSGPQGEGRGIPPQTARAYPQTDPDRPAKAFLLEYRDLFGHGPEILEKAAVKRQFTSLLRGTRTKVWQQEWNGLEIWGALFVSHTSRKGELISLSSQFIPDPGRAAGQGKIQATLTAREAILKAAANLDMPLDGTQVSALGNPPAAPEWRGKFHAPGCAGTVETRLVWLPLSRESLRLCWEVVMTLQSRGETYRLFIDHETGQVRVRHGLTQYLSEASYRVFTGDSPTPFSPGHLTFTNAQPPQVSRGLVTITALDTNASPLGWINDGDNETQGNNVRAHLDVDGDNQPDLPLPQGSPFRVFDFPMDLTQPPSSYREAAVVQLFYWNNWMHDRLYELGFTEAAGNFQVTNFNRRGAGNDPVEADAQDGSGLNNANMTTFGDGTPGRMQMYVFNYAPVSRDGDLDGEVILHEYTHGLSNRRVGGGAGITAVQSSGLGEGWSDFYALALLSEAGDDPRGNYAFGAYVSYLMAGQAYNYYYGIRRYPYTTDLTKNPLTFKDIDPGQASLHSGIPRNPGATGGADQAHRQGEVWGSALWEARFNLIEKYGFETGNRLILELVTEGMNLTPPNPTFVQARNGILQADLADNDGVNQEALWTAFAKRGLGYSAYAPPSSTTVGVREAFDIPDDLKISPQAGFTSQGPVGGPFDPPEQEFELENTGTNAVVWEASSPDSWLSLDPASGVLNPEGTPGSVRAAIEPAADFLPPGIYSTTVTFTNHTSGRTQQRRIVLRAGQPDYFTEFFEGRSSDLGFKRLTLTPDGSSSLYRACLEDAATFAVDPAGGNSLPLADDRSALVTLAGGAQVRFYGQAHRSFFIGSNGYLTFDSGDEVFEVALASHFNRVRLSAFFADLDPSAGGTVSWKQLPDRAAVTYQNVPQFRTNLRNSFQIELFFDGTIRMTWLELEGTSALAGLSPGGGLPAGFLQSDLSAYPSCTKYLLLNLPAQAIEGEGTLTHQGLVSFSDLAEADRIVRLRSSNPAEVVVPDQVVVPAGETEAEFDLMVVDDTRVDGSQRTHVTAQAPDYAQAVATIEVQDNESAVLTVTFPQSTREGDGAIEGVLSLDQPAGASIRVDVESSDPGEIQVPTQVVIPAGSTSIPLTATVVDDGKIDGDRTVTVFARVPHWMTGFASILVADNETRVLRLSAPSLANEAAGILIGAGTVTLSGTLDTNLVITLASSNTATLLVPETVMIPAGQTNQAFDLTLINNEISDGNRSVLLVAAAEGWTNGMATVQVYDDETPPPPAQPTPPDLASNVAASTDLFWTIEEPGGGPPSATSFEVYLGTNPSLGVEQLLGVTTNKAWDLPQLAPFTTYYWQIVARRIGATPGPVWQFTTKGIDRFVWSPIPSHLRAGTPFPVTLTALDESGTIVSNFHGDVALTGQTGAGGTGSRVLISEVDPGTPDGAEFVNVSSEELDLSGWQISFYDNSAWPSPATTFTVPPGTHSRPGDVFHLWESGVFPGVYPDFFAGTNIAWVHGGNPNQMAVLVRDPAGNIADFMCAAGAYSGQIVEPIVIPSSQWNDSPLAANPVPTMDYQRVGNMDHNNGLDWVVAPSNPGITHSNLVLPFADSLRQVRLNPTNAAPFIDGIWQGEIAVLEPARNLTIQARDLDGHLGLSGPFLVHLSNDLALALQAQPEPVVQGSNLTYQLTIYNAGPDDASGIRLTNEPPEGVSPDSISSSQGSCGQVEGIIVCDLGSLTAGASLDVTIQVRVETTGSLTNRAAIGRSEPESDPSNDQALVISLAVPVPSLAVSDTLVLEGNQGTNTMTFPVLLSHPVAHEVRVDYTTLPGTAEPGLDYRSTAGTLVFAPGAVRESVAVSILGETLFEENETVFLALSNAVGALIDHGLGLGTILNDDVAPSLVISDAAVLEGDEGVTNAVFRVSLSCPSTLPLTVTYATSDITAQAGLDYEAQSGLLSFPPGTTNQELNVAVRGDRLNEALETFSVLLSQATNGIIADAQGVGMIMDDDPLPVLAISDASVIEGNSGLRQIFFSVSLLPVSGQSVSVQVATTTNGTARPGVDFNALLTTLAFSAGITNRLVQVPVRGDTEIEPDETLTVLLSNPVHAVLERAEGVGLIVNDDLGPGDAAQIVWEPVPSPRNILEPFPVRVTALDAWGNLASNFNGTVLLDALAGGHEKGGILNAPLVAGYTNTGNVTIGYAFTPTTNLLVTHVRHYFGQTVSLWTEAGQLLARQAVLGEPGVWRETRLAVPVPLAANHRYRLGVQTGGSAYFWEGNLEAQFPHGSIDASYQSPGDDFPAGIDQARWYFVDLRYLAGARADREVTPAVSGTFDHGQWNGTLAVDGVAPDMVLTAEDRLGQIGFSNPFEVQPVNDLSILIEASPDPLIFGEVLSSGLSVSNSGPALATNVLVQFELPENTDLVSAQVGQGSIISFQGNVMTLNMGTLPSGTAAQATFQLQPQMTGGNLRLTASVQSQKDEPYLDNNWNAVDVSLLAPVTILRSPESQTVILGAPVTFAVAAFGIRPLHYQWWRDQVSLPDQTNAVLVLPGAQLADSGFYSVTVDDGTMGVASSPVELLVNPPPVGAPFGFLSVDLPPGYSAMVYPFRTEQNTVSQILPSMPSGTTLLKPTRDGFVANQYLEGWSQPDMSLVPGEGFFINNPTPMDWTVDLLGDLLEGTLINQLPSHFSLAGSVVPQRGKLSSLLEFPAAAGDAAFVYDPDLAGYQVFRFTAGSWTPSEPVIGLVQSFWSRKSEAADWVRRYSAFGLEIPDQTFRFRANAAQGQAGQINFFTFNPDPAFGRVLNTDHGTPVNGAFRGQLYLGPNEANPILTPVGIPVPFDPDEAAGYIRGGAVSVPGTENGRRVQVQLRVWKAGQGATYEAALANGGLTGESAITTLTLGATVSGPYPGQPPPQANAFPTFWVRSNQTNTAPALAAIADRIIHATATLTITNEAVDAETPNGLLRFDLTMGPPGAQLDPVSGLFTWTPSLFDVGTTNEVTVRVTDDGDPPLSAERTFSVAVAPKPLLSEMMVLTNGEVKLSWSAVPGVQYRVQYKSDLNDADWIDVVTPITASNTTANITDLIGPVPQRFYRILVLP
jgi:uncharacterized repeat protein (TIGR01451 family)